MQEFSADFLTLLPGYALKIGVAVLCGLLLGTEREAKDKPAGVRTIILITVGATIFMIVSELIPLVTGGPESITRVDPSRIASQVVTGIGFLGAGSIIQARGSIQGLTTAAVIWVSAGIGLCVGIGFPVLAIGVTLIVLATLRLLNPFRRWLSRRGAAQTLDLVVPNDSLTLQRVTHVLHGHDVRDDDMLMTVLDADHVHLRARYRTTGSATLRLLEALARIDDVHGTHVDPLPK